MGQAKLRGTYEQRKEAAIEKENLFLQACQKALTSGNKRIEIANNFPEATSPRTAKLLLAAFITLGQMR